MIPIVQISDIPDLNENNIKYSSFQDNLKIMKWIFSTTQNITYLFDKCKVNDTFPFIYCKIGGNKEYTKILNGKSVSSHLIEDISEFNIKNDNVDKKTERHTDYLITWYYNGSQYQKIFITPKFIEFHQLINIKLKLKTIILDLLEYANVEEYIDEEHILKTKGLFYVWNIPNFNQNIFFDFIMNNDIGRKFLIIRENLTLKKSRKKNIKLTYTFPSENGNLSSNLSIMVKVLEKGQDIFKTRHWIDIGLGNVYLSINMSSSKQENIDITPKLLEKIIKVFGNLMSSYADEAKNIQKAYLKAGISDDAVEFFKRKTVGIKKRITLKDKVPEMFVNHYTRQCQKHQNKKLKEIQVYETLEEAKAIVEEKGLQYMAYPADDEYLEYVKEHIGDEDEDLNPIPIDNKTYYFVCDNEVHTIPGLMVNNKLVNKDKFPYLPCCYAQSKEQLSKGTGLWNYLHGVNPNESVSHAVSDVKIKGKIQLKPNVRGPISIQLEDTFKIIKSDYKFMRIGIDGSRYESFIGCLNRALSIEIDIDDMIADEKSVNIGQLKQCNYDMSIQQIIEMLQDKTSYLDPRRVVPFFESFYNINIIMFEDVMRSDGFFETTIVQPRHKNGYLSWEHKRKHTVLIYLSTGSQHIQEERCELIIAESGEGKLLTVFNRSVYEYLRFLTVNIHNQFSLFTPYSFFVLPEFINGVKFQTLDSYGKVCRLQIDDFTIDTQPLPPIPNVRIKKMSIKLIKDAEQLKELLKDSEYLIRNNKIIVKKSEINFVLYWNHDATVVDIKTYSAEKHSANILKDLFIYNFSKYLDKYYNKLTKKERKKFILSDLSQDFFKTFIDSINIVENDEEFENISSFLLNYPPKFNKQYKNLKYPNKSCKERLYYYLNLLIKYNPKYLIDYKDNIYLDHYYTSLYDFTQSDKYLLTSSLDSVEFINKQYTTSDTIVYNFDDPYFIFSKWTLHDTPILTLNLYSTESAIKLSTFWKKHRYIPDRDDEGKFTYPEEFDTEYTLSSEQKFTILNLDDTTDLEKVVEVKPNAKAHQLLIAMKTFKNIEDETDEIYYCPILS